MGLIAVGFYLALNLIFRTKKLLMQLTIRMGASTSSCIYLPKEYIPSDFGYPLQGALRYV
jgi:hypothetical protein